MIRIENGAVAVIAHGGRVLAVVGAEAAAPDARGYLLPPVFSDGEVTLQIDTARSSPGVTALRICGPGRIYPLNGTEAVAVPIGELTDDPDAPVLFLAVEAVTAGGLTGPMTGMVLVNVGEEGPDPEPEPEPEPEPGAGITAPASLTVVNPWDEGDGFTVNAPTISGTPSAGPTVTWEFRPAAGGDWTPGAAWVGTVPVIAEAMDVRLVTTITPGAGQAPVSAVSDVYRAIPAPAPEIPPAPLTAGQIVVIAPSVHRPGGQTVTFSPQVQFPGLTAETIQFNRTGDGNGAGAWHTVTAVGGGTFELFATGHPIAPPAYDAALWTAPAADLRFRYRVTAGGLWSAPSATVAVPPPPATAALIAAPAPATVTAARAQPLYVFDETKNTGVNRPRTAHVYPLIARAAWLGNAAAATYMVNQFNGWDKSYPSAMGGIRGQRDLAFALCAAYGQKTPAVWNALGNATKTRITRAMEGLLASWVWHISDTNPFVGGNERSLRGDNNWGRGFNPNFTVSYYIGPQACCSFLGDAAANAFLANFNRANFAAAIAAANGNNSMGQMLATFNQNWANGPTAAQLKVALTNGAAPVQVFGATLAQGTQQLTRVLANVMWTKNVKVGLTLAANAKIPAGYPARTPGAIGIFEPAQKLNAKGSVGRGRFVGKIRAGGVAGLPNLGQLGMARELDATDGGMNGSGGGPRASVNYVGEGAWQTVSGAIAMFDFGRANVANGALAAALRQQQVGCIDWAWRIKFGHDDFSKGGWPWAGAGNDGNKDNYGWADANADLYAWVLQQQTALATWAGTAQAGWDFFA